MKITSLVTLPTQINLLSGFIFAILLNSSFDFSNLCRVFISSNLCKSVPKKSTRFLFSNLCAIVLAGEPYCPTNDNKLSCNKHPKDFKYSNF